MATSNQFHWDPNKAYGIVAHEVGQLAPAEYEIRDPEPSSITMMSGGLNSEEMIRVAPDGFYVRGVRVPADDREAETVYLAFKQWLAWANLQRR